MGFYDNCIRILQSALSHDPDEKVNPPLSAWLEGTSATQNGARRLNRDYLGVDVETDKAGNVVSVWYGCQPLPFRQRKVGLSRSVSMMAMYDDAMDGIELTGVDIGK